MALEPLFYWVKNISFSTNQLQNKIMSSNNVRCFGNCAPLFPSNLSLEKYNKKNFFSKIPSGHVTNNGRL